MTKRVALLSVLGFALSLGLAATSPRTARAEEDPSRWAGGLSDALRRQDFRKIVMSLLQLKDEDFVKALADNPGACHTAMRGVAKSIGKLAAEYEDFAKHVLQTLEEVDKLLVKAHADDPQSARANGALHAAKAHYAWVCGKDFEIDDWEQALASTAKSYAGATGPVSANEADAAADGCIWMREVYRHPKLKGDPSLLGVLLPSAQTLADVATAATGDDAHAEVVRGQGRLLAAQRAYLAGGASKAAPILEPHLTALKKYAAAGGDAVATSLYNDSVTFARSYKIPTKAQYVFAEQPTTAGGLQYRIPLGSRWQTDVGDDDRVVGSFYAYDTMGRTVRNVRIRTYRWDRLYVVSDTEEVGGDNARGLAKMVVKFYRDDFSNFKETPLVKSSFAKKLPAGQVFELVGVDGNYNYLRVRVIFVKGKERHITYCIEIKDLEDFGKTDAEMEEILDTFVEVKEK